MGLKFERSKGVRGAKWIYACPVGLSPSIPMIVCVACHLKRKECLHIQCICSYEVKTLCWFVEYELVPFYWKNLLLTVFTDYLYKIISE